MIRIERPANREYLYVRGRPVLSMDEFASYAYGIPEDAVPPPLITRWAYGEEVALDELLQCLRSDALDAAGDSDQALEAVRLALERLKAMFPDEAG